MAEKKKNKSILSRREQKSLDKIDESLSSIIDDVNISLYGTNQDPDIKDLDTTFNSILRRELDSVVRHTNSDSTGLLARLVNEDSKVDFNSKSIETILGSDSSEVFNFISNQYQNRCIKQNDLHEVASQLVELREAILVTRDAIVSSNVNEPGISKTIDFKNIEKDKANNALSIIKDMEKATKIDSKMKNFIVPRTLEFGEYWVITTPYSKIFNDFQKKKNELGTGYTSMNRVFESAEDDIKYTEMYKSYYGESATDKGFSTFKDDIQHVFENVSISNSTTSYVIDRYGVESIEELKAIMEAGEKSDSPTKDIFKQVNSIDDGITGEEKIKGDFNNISGCHIQLVDPMHMIELKIIDTTIGYYLVEEEDIQPISGLVSTTLYYSRFDENKRQKTIIDGLVERIVKSFDKKYLESNIELKDTIANALMYFDLNTKKLRFKYIPVEYVTKFSVNADERGTGTSIIEPSLFYAKLYLMLLLFKIMSILLYSNDTKVNYVKTSGIDKNVSNKIQDIIRKKQSRQINLMDMFSYTTLLKKLGSGSEMYIPTGRSNERGIETEILQGQEVQINNELMEMLKKSYVLGTGVPSAIMNYLDEVDFAKSIELANTRFNGRVVTYQGDINESATELYKKILKFSTSLDSETIDALSYTLSAPKHAEATLKTELIQSFDVYRQYFLNMFFGEIGVQDPANAVKVRLFTKGLAKKWLPMLDITEIEKLYEDVEMEARQEELDPKNKALTEEIDNIPGLD